MLKGKIHFLFLFHCFFLTQNSLFHMFYKQSVCYLTEILFSLNSQSLLVFSKKDKLFFYKNQMMIR